MQAFADFSDGVLGGVLLGALSVTLGSVPWMLAVLRPWQAALPARARDRGLALLIGGALAVAACRAAALGLKLVTLSEQIGAATFGRFAATLQFRAGAAQIVIALALALATAWLYRRPRAAGRWTVVVLLTAGLALSGAWTVHAAARLEQRAPLMVLTVLHQIAAAAWVGGVVQLVAVSRLVRRDVEVAAIWPTLVRRFAAVAATGIAALLVAAVPLAWTYVGSWQGFIGSAYGSLIGVKVMLMLAALLLGGLNFLGGRSRDGAVVTRVPILAEAEAILLLVLLFAAATLSSQPPAIDTVPQRATVAEVAEVFRPKWPALRTPSVDTMVAQDAEAAVAVAGGERTREAYLWSNFSHNVAGLFLLAISMLALVATVRPGSAARHWPLAFVGLGVFVFLRTSANDGIWPFGPISVWTSMVTDAEVLQHRIGAALAVLVGVLEWRARSGGTSRRLPYVFPVLAASGGVLLLTHAHAPFELKSAYLVQVTHTTMGALAVLMACARLLELRLPATSGRAAGTASTIAMLLIALVLVFYREANVVIPPE